MSESTSPNPPEAKSFWTTVPGLVTAIGGLVAAIAALVTALGTAGVFSPKTPTATAVPPTPTAAPVAIAVVSPSPWPTILVAPVTSTPPGTPAKAVAASPTPSGVLYEDTFSADTGEWSPETKSDYEVGYEGGELRMAVYDAQVVVYDYLKKRFDFADFAVEVDVRQVSGPEDGSYGLVVRYQPSDEFYLFEISGVGSVGVRKYLGGDWHDIQAWAESPAIHQGKAVNRLRVVAEGPRMRFYVNGELVAEVTDSSFRSGSIGLAASTYGKGGVVTAFDNLRVRALTAR